MRYSGRTGDEDETSISQEDGTQFDLREPLLSF